MKNNEKLVQKVRKILNTNKKCQDMMKILVDKAKAVGMSAEQFEQFKISLMTNIVLKMALEHEDIKKQLCDEMSEDIWNELRKENAK